MLYGALFLAAGAILLAITYALVANSLPTAHVSVAGKNALVVQRAGGGQPVPSFSLPGGPIPVPPGKRDVSVFLRAYNGKVARTFKRLTAAQGAQIRVLTANATEQLNHQRSVELASLLTKSGIALGIMALVAIGFGWLMAGRALRPVRTMSARARGISERNLHERLALAGPNDELKELGDTFDELLARLEKAFESQRRFVSNASHELRTPITLERTLIEVALADPNVSMESLQDTCRRVIAAGSSRSD